MGLLQLLLMLGLAVPDAPKPVVTVTVRAASDVPGRTFTLGEIAEITGADKALATQVAAVEIGTSPLPGLSRPLYPGDILTRLRLHRIDPKRLNLVAPPAIRVTRGGSEIPPDEIVKAATEALLAARKDPDDGAIVEAVPLTTRLFVAAGAREYRAGAPRGQVEGGAAVVPVSVLVDGRPAKTVEVAFKIRRLVAAVVAKRALEARTVLTADDVATANIELSPGAPPPLTDPEAVIGKRTTRRIVAGAPLSATALETVPVIAAGAKVTAQVVMGSIQISAPAIARTPGAVGDVIRLFVLDTRKELRGTIVDESTVRVEGNP